MNFHKKQLKKTEGDVIHNLTPAIRGNEHGHVDDQLVIDFITAVLTEHREAAWHEIDRMIGMYEPGSAEVELLYRVLSIFGPPPKERRDS